MSNLGIWKRAQRRSHGKNKPTNQDATMVLRIERWRISLSIPNGTWRKAYSVSFSYLEVLSKHERSLQGHWCSGKLLPLGRCCLLNPHQIHEDPGYPRQRPHKASWLMPYSGGTQLISSQATFFLGKHAFAHLPLSCPDAEVRPLNRGRQRGTLNSVLVMIFFRRGGRRCGSLNWCFEVYPANDNFLALQLRILLRISLVRILKFYRGVADSNPAQPNHISCRWESLRHLIHRCKFLEASISSPTSDKVPAENAPTRGAMLQQLHQLVSRYHLQNTDESHLVSEHMGWSLSFPNSAAWLINPRMYINSHNEVIRGHGIPLPKSPLASSKIKGYPRPKQN